MEQVEWAKLDYAYGEATNVSELIQTVAFGDEAEACKACTTLHGELVHQSSIYSSTYEAIPFLIEALAVTGSGSGARRGVLRLLGDIAWSCVHWIEVENNTDLALAEGQDGWAPPDKWIERAWLGSELFGRLLQDDDNADVRTHAARLLGMLLTLGTGLAPAGPLGRYASAVAKLIQEVDLLIDTMCRAAETDMLYHVGSGTDRERRSPWIVAELRFRLRACLCAWSAGDRARMERVLPALLTGVRLTSGYVASVDLEPVFQWLWPDRRTSFLRGANGEFEYVRPPPVTPRDLAGVARRVVQACYDNPSIWEPPVGNTDVAFRDVGLPETRVGLRDLLDSTA